ncbi:YceI family protein [Kordia jejudonensis]|uniref:YceI family protein n=1 Tax=Kordia jejudonensis TaxID=1348245 RepID=UPI00069C37A0|nr:YceI family protein [Kordia jejudonensis]
MKKLCTCLAILFFTQMYAQDVLPIDTKKSEIKWSCDYSFYFNGHYGFVKFKDGFFSKTNDKITGGSFTIDLHTLEATDMEEEGNKGLTEHLKDPDFFEVVKFPTATLVITRVNYLQSDKIRAEADLTIKGITQPVKFDATLDFANKTMKTKFKIDRTRWGITYNSEIKDSAISDAIGFDVTLSL